MASKNIAIADGEGDGGNGTLWEGRGIVGEKGIVGGKGHCGSDRRGILWKGSILRSKLRCFFCFFCVRKYVGLCVVKKKTNLVVFSGKESLECVQTFLSLSWGPSLNPVQILSSLEGVGFFANMGAHAWFLRAPTAVWRVSKLTRKLEFCTGAKRFGGKRALL